MFSVNLGRDDGHRMFLRVESRLRGGREHIENFEIPKRRILRTLVDLTNGVGAIFNKG